MEIRYWDRAKNAECIEKVYGQNAIRWIYESSVGKRVSSALLSGPGFSRLYGWLQSSPPSRKKIGAFIRDFEIPMNEFEEKEYRSFNEFFIRRFKPGARTFVESPNLMPAFAEARYFGWRSISNDQLFPVKGQYLSPESLLGGTRWASQFDGGPLLLARLCPVDYHRFHFPDDGEVLESYPMHGLYHSVNPVALGVKGDIFCTNERQVTILRTVNFGLLAYIEVGAMCVGKIVQSHGSPKFRRGDEKGYFLFGGSTVIVLGEKGKWSPDQEILDRTLAKQECLIRLGEQLAARDQDAKRTEEDRR